MENELYCAACKKHTPHMVRRWKENGVWGSLSILCSECGRLGIAELAELPEVKIDLVEEA